MFFALFSEVLWLLQFMQITVQRKAIKAAYTVVCTYVHHVSFVANDGEVISKCALIHLHNVIT